MLILSVAKDPGIATRSFATLRKTIYPAARSKGDTCART